MVLPVPAPRASARWLVRRCAAPFDVRAETLTLYSMLSPAAYAVPAAEGVLRANRTVIDPDFAEAYDWLAQAKRRVPGAVGRYPIWFWASPTWSCRPRTTWRPCRPGRHRQISRRPPRPPRPA